MSPSPTLALKRTHESENKKQAKTVPPVSDMIHPPNTVVLTLKGIEINDLENLPNMKIPALVPISNSLLASGMNH